MTSLFTKLFGRRTKSAQQSSTRLSVEALEDRQVMDAYWNPVADPTIGFTPAPTLTAVTRGSTHTDLFEVGKDGGIYCAGWWDADVGGAGWGGWNAGYRIPTWVTALPGSEVTAVTRGTTHTDLFVVGKDGNVYCAGWWDAYQNGGAWNGGYRISNTVTALPCSKVTAVTRGTTHTDLFMVGANGNVYCAGWWDAYQNGGAWNSGYLISTGVTGMPGSPVTAVTRGTTHTDLFVVDMNGNVNCAAWWDAYQNGGAWNGGYRIPNTVAALPGAEVTAVTRGTTHTDLFMVGANGNVYCAGWWDAYQNGGAWNVGYSIPTWVTALPGSKVTAVTRGTTHTDLFVMGKDGGVYCAGWWDAYQNGGAWNSGYLVQSLVTGIPGATVTAVTRDSAHTDLFVVGIDGGSYCGGWWDQSKGVTFNSGYTVSRGFDGIPDWFDLNLRDPALRFQSRFVWQRDGAGMTRNSMLHLFYQAGRDGLVSNNELLDLRTLVANPASLRMADYVRVLSNKIVNGDVANAHYQGGVLGNLVAWSNTAQLNKLVSKWFLGDDHPALLQGDAWKPYRAVNGKLFGGNGTPSYLDVAQGTLGDCTIMASMAEVAFVNPSLISNMIFENGDGTYTVRFIHDSVADYVTVDNKLPADAISYLTWQSDPSALFGGRFVTVYQEFDGGTLYANPQKQPFLIGGSLQSLPILWPALLEKAFAQMNEAGWLGMYQAGINSYEGLAHGTKHTIEGALKAITGRPSDSFFFGYIGTTGAGDIATVLKRGGFVVLGTEDSPDAALVPNHAYAILKYEPATDAFLFFNPWGNNSAGQGKEMLLVRNGSYLTSNFKNGGSAGSGLVAGNPAKRITEYDHTAAMNSTVADVSLTVIPGDVSVQVSRDGAQVSSHTAVAGSQDNAVSQAAFGMNFITKKNTVDENLLISIFASGQEEQDLFAFDLANPSLCDFPGSELDERI